MKIGILHNYTLTGSGSGIYVRELARHLTSRGHEIHIISHELKPQEYNLFRSAYAYQDNSVNKLFSQRDMPNCHSHSLTGKITPVAYKRPDIPDGKLFIQLSNQEIDDYIDFCSSTIIKICQRHKLDILHANHALLMPYIASIIKSQQGIPYVVTIHGSTIEYVLKQDKRYHDYVRNGLRDADKIIGLNSDVVSRILEMNPDSHSAIIEISNGVDIESFAPVDIAERKNAIKHIISDLRVLKGEGKSQASCDRIKSSFERGFDSEKIVTEFTRIRASYAGNRPDINLDEKLDAIRWEKEKVVLYSGSLRFDKGIHCLIAAIPYISATHSDCRFIIAGDGDDREYMEAAIWALDRGDIDLFQRILYLAIVELRSGGSEVYQYIPSFLRNQDLETYYDMARGNVRDKVIFTGYLSRRCLSRLLGCVTVNIIPSIVKEAFPLTFIESLSCGVLPVASYYAGLIPPLDKLATDLGDIGKLCMINHAPEFMICDLASNIAAILSQLEDTVYAEQIKQLCREMAELEYRWDRVASLTEEVYSTCHSSEITSALTERSR
ncbi:MAG: glycosyltransferase family 4 protein [Chloroflexota bacterium]|nr:glycosyltransferase family 4 protein [Chloroflexota bacterium]